MCDYYTQFSAELPLTTVQEKEWWQTMLTETWTPTDGRGPDALQVLDEVKAIRAAMEEEGCIGWGFDWRVEDARVWFYADSSGTIEELLELVHIFFKTMCPDGDDEFILLWADTCSEPRLDSFSGGTAVVTKNGIGYCGADAQLQYALENIKPPPAKTTKAALLASDSSNIELEPVSNTFALDGLINTLNHALTVLGRGFVTMVLDTYVRVNDSVVKHPTFCCSTERQLHKLGPLGMLSFFAGVGGAGQNNIYASIDNDNLVRYFHKTDNKPIQTPHRRLLTVAELRAMWSALYLLDPAAYEVLHKQYHIHQFFNVLMGVNNVLTRTLDDVEQVERADLNGALLIGTITKNNKLSNDEVSNA